MSHSITESQYRNPMWYFEQNYCTLMHVLDELCVLEEGSTRFEFQNTLVCIRLLEQTRYTLLVELQQQFSQPVEVIPDLLFRVRVYLDARVAEVVSYQGKQHLKARYSLPNLFMYHPDEKRQTNLLLYDWLTYCVRLNFRESGVLNYLN